MKVLENKKLRIAFMLNHFPTLSETFIVNQIIYLLKQGHEVEIFSFQKGDLKTIHNCIRESNLMEKVNYFKGKNPNKWKMVLETVKFIPLVKKNQALKDYMRALNVFRFGRKAFNLTLINTILWFRKRKPFDVIHSHFGPNGEFIAELRSKGFLCEPKFVNTFHGFDFNPSLIEHWKTRYKILFEQADLLTYNTPYSISILEKIFNDLSKFAELPVGLDTNLFSKTPRSANNSESKFQILFCGRFVEFKAPYLAVEIMNAIVNKNGVKNVYLTMVGAGPLEGPVRGLIENYNLHEYIELKGGLTQEAIVDEMRKADLFILPGIVEKDGRAETQGLVIQEAQSMELPVLVSDAGGMKYGLLDGITGFVLPQKDVNAFVEKIMFLMLNPSIRNKMGTKGREFVVENYDINILGKRLENLYYSMLDKELPPRQS